MIRKVCLVTSAGRGMGASAWPDLSPRRRSSTKKGNDWHFGMKAHIGADADSGVTHNFDTSTAALHDSQIWDALLLHEETSVWAELSLERLWSEP